MCNRCILNFIYLFKCRKFYYLYLIYIYNTSHEQNCSAIYNHILINTNTECISLLQSVYNNGVDVFDYMSFLPWLLYLCREWYHICYTFPKIHWFDKFLTLNSLKSLRGQTKCLIVSWRKIIINYYTLLVYFLNNYNI